MTCLIDTHVFLWAVMEPKRLSRSHRDVLKEGSAQIFVSVVSFWEISLKYGIGKLDLRGVTPSELLPAAEKMDLRVLALEPEEAATFDQLPQTSHKDPFDRLIIWQAIRGNWPLLTADSKLQNYSAFGLKIVI